jgi:pyruvate kinase
MRRTKIVATLGPATDPPGVLEAVLDAGVDVVRLGLAHGDAAEHRRRITLVRDAADRRGATVGVLADLPGPKVRAGTFPEGGAFLAEGDEVALVGSEVGGEGASTSRRIVIDEPQLVECVAAGDTVVLGDGIVTLEVTDVAADDVRAVVRSGGRLQGRPGVHLPSDHWLPPVPTDDDLRLIDEVAGNADWVAVSFVRRADELGRVRDALGPDGPRVMAKIETRAAVDDLDDLLAVSDGVMVARGDLGVDLPIADVPYLQKRIIRASGSRGLPVVTATQMLESMVTAPSPTRAEASDVANAVVDGSDALMLSAETAIGHDPALAVRTMASIAARTEETDDQYGSYEQGRGQRHALAPGPSTQAVTAAMAHAARQAASELRLDAVVCCTRAGATARAMAALRPACRLIGASPSVATIRQLALSWGVEPLLVGEYATTDEMVWCVVEAAVRDGLVHHGESIAVLAGAPDASPGRSDVLRIVAVS